MLAPLSLHRKPGSAAALCNLGQRLPSILVHLSKVGYWECWQHISWLCSTKLCRLWSNNMWLSTAALNEAVLWFWGRPGMRSCDCIQAGVLCWGGKKLHLPSRAVKCGGDKRHRVFVVTWLGDLPAPPCFAFLMISEGSSHHAIVTLW